MERELTAEAQADRDDFVREYGHDGDCSCHLSPPCNSCLHPGNPAQQAEDESCWTNAEAPAVTTTAPLNTTPYVQRGYLMTLQEIGDGLQAIGKPLDTDQSRVVAHVLAQRYVKEGDIDRAVATLDALRHQRLERRLQGDRRAASVPVEVDRRQGERRSGEDRREVREPVTSEAKPA